MRGISKKRSPSAPRRPEEPRTASGEKSDRARPRPGPFEDRLRPRPPRQRDRLVAAEQKHQLVSAALLAQRAQRVDGVRRTRPVELEARGLEPLVPRDRGAAQLEPGLPSRISLDHPVRRLSDRNQRHPVEVELHDRLLRAHEMPEVGRVEDAPEDAQPQVLAPRRSVRDGWPAPSTTYLNVQSSRKPIGPRAWSFWVELPISAPRPNSPPSVKRVEALT